MVADKHHEGCFKNHLHETDTALFIGKAYVGIFTFYLFSTTYKLVCRLHES
jgi:hypothetical protein